MNPSREYLQHCSIQTGYQITPLEKVVRLGEMAGDITRHPFLGKVLALKGGTVLNLCFGPPKRLSVDLDYNYIGNLEREKMLEDRPRVEEAIYELSKRRGYRPQWSADAFAGRKIYLCYRSVVGQDDRIEVDLNYIFRLPLVSPEVRDLWQPGELDRVQVRVVGHDEKNVKKRRHKELERHVRVSSLFSWRPSWRSLRLGGPFCWGCGVAALRYKCPRKGFVGLLYKFSGFCLVRRIMSRVP
jgi:hypothetical protein